MDPRKFKPAPQTPKESTNSDTPQNDPSSEIKALLDRCKSIRNDLDTSNKKSAELAAKSSETSKKNMEKFKLYTEQKDVLDKAWWRAACEDKKDEVEQVNKALKDLENKFYPKK